MGIICGSVGVSGIGGIGGIGGIKGISGIGGIKVCVFNRWGIDSWRGLLGSTCVGINSRGACGTSLLSCIFSSLSCICYDSNLNGMSSLSCCD
jgi:hypothetical protein